SANDYAASGDGITLTSAKNHADAGDNHLQAELDSHEHNHRAHDATSHPTPERIIVRDVSGRAQVQSPADDADIATKSYVDGIALLSNIGQITFGPFVDPLPNFLVLDGSEHSRSQYGLLWLVIQDYYDVKPDAYHGFFPGSFSDGNGTSTFRLPDMSG